MQILLGAVGAGIGSFFGAAGTGWSIGTLVGGLLFRPSLPNQERGKLEDLRVGGSSYGAALPRLWGKARLSSNIIWAANLNEVVTEEHVGGGMSGGGGGGGGAVTTYSYTSSFAAAFCEITSRQAARILRIWADDQLIFDGYTPIELPVMRFHLGGESELADTLIDGSEGDTPSMRGIVYIVFEEMALADYGNRIPQISAEVETFEYDGTTPPKQWNVGSVIRDIGMTCGIPDEYMDISEGLSFPLTGLIQSNRQPARDLINLLLQAHPIDLVEVDGLLKLVPRNNNNPAVTLTEEELGCRVWDGSVGEGAAELPWQLERTSELELSERVDVVYFDADKLYETGMQSAVRYAKPGVYGSRTINLPLVLKKDEARRIAERALYLEWWERNQFQTTLGLRRAALAPGSIVHVPIAGDVRRFRIVRQGLPFFGPMSIHAVEDSPDTLTQISSGGSGDTWEPGPIDPVTTYSHTWHGPGIRQQDVEHLGLYVAAGGGENWAGASVYISRDNGASWQLLGGITKRAYVGEVVFYPPWHATDRLCTAQWQTADDHYFEIQMHCGTLQTRSYRDVLEGANAMLVGREIIQFREATDLGGGLYRLRKLLRGCRGTDLWNGMQSAYYSHYVGEPAVLLNQAVVRYEPGDDLLLQSIRVKIVPAGKSINDVNFTVLGPFKEEWRPWTPCLVTAVRELNNDLTLSWKRRERTGGFLRDELDVELSDSPLLTHVHLYKTQEAVVWLRRLTINDVEYCTYTAAQQLVDFDGNYADVLGVAPEQQSHVAGRGRFKMYWLTCPPAGD